MFSGQEEDMDSWPTCGKSLRPLITFANCLDRDNDQKNVGLNLRSTLFDTQIMYRQNCGWKQ